jgi:uncharacterized membrane protein SirB2
VSQTGEALAWVPAVRHVHLALVLASGLLFAARGAGVLAGARWPLLRAWRALSVLVDTALLSAGITLWTLLRLDPLRDHWLGAKLVLLVLYVLLGTWALRRARTRGARVVFFCAALTVFATMFSIGWTRDPLGLWRVP